MHVPAPDLATWWWPTSPYPVPIICALLGAPPQDWQRFSAGRIDVLRLFSWNIAGTEDDILRSDELDQYVDHMVAERTTL